MDRATEKAISNIVKAYDPISISTFDDGSGLLVIVESPVNSRARRTEIIRDAMGKAGRGLDLMVYTPAEVLELRGESQSPIGSILARCEDVHGSTEGFR